MTGGIRKRALVWAVEAASRTALAAARMAGSAPKDDPVYSRDRVRKILIVDCGFLGDTIISLPTVSSFRRAFPDARISVLMHPNWSDVWKHVRDYDELIPYEPPWVRHPGALRLSDIPAYRALAGRLRRERFDLVADLRGDGRNILLLSFPTRAPYRFGFGITGGGCLLTHAVPFPDRNEVENNLAIARAAGGDAAPHEFPVGKEEREKVRSLLARHGIRTPRILLFPGAAYPLKEWEDGAWARLCDGIGDSAGIILSGAPGEPRCAAVERLSGGRAVNWAGRLDLNETAALMAQCDLAVGVDTGPMHLAAAVGLRTVVLMGPTCPRRWSPYRNCTVLTSAPDCAPCGLHRRCRKEKGCMKEIAPETVLEAVGRALSGPADGTGRPS